MAIQNITVKINNAEQTVQTYKVAGGNGGVGSQGKPLVIQAQANVRYELVNDATHFGPENIAVKRSGQDLLIAFEGGSVDAPDLIIEDYYKDNGALGYNEGSNNLVVGQHQSGAYYAYIPESGNAADAISVLANHALAGQVLGGVELTSPWWLAAAAGGISPWAAALAGLAVAGIAAAGGGGSDGSSQKPAQDTTAPDAPTADISKDGTTVSGKAEPGATVTVKDANGKTIGTGTADDKGDYSITIPVQPEGSKLPVSATDKAGNESGATNVTAPDVTVPTVPTADISKDGTTVSGKAEPGATVTVKDA
ncbi:Ig-like domain-containing protein, partial [Paralysiella testudinis]